WVPWATVCATRCASMRSAGMRSAKPWASDSSAGKGSSFLSRASAKPRSPQRLDELSHHVAHLDPFGTGGEGERHAVLEHGFGELDDVVDRGGKPSVHHRLGADGKHQRLARAWARPPGDHIVELLVDAGAGPRGADQLENRVDHLVADGKLAHQSLRH